MNAESLPLRMPLKTKLLISTIASLLLLILFLNLSSLVLFKEDKRAYVYQAQATKSSLAARDFVQTLRHSVDTLRVGLGSIDPKKTITPQQHSTLQALMNNQSDLIFLNIGKLDAVHQQLKGLTTSVRDLSWKELQLTATDFDIPSESIPGLLSELKAQGYSLLNFSKTEGLPLLGILISDLKAASAEGIPIALGVVPLKDFAQGVAGEHLSVATLTGRVLYDSDPGVLYIQKDLSHDPLFKTSISSTTGSGVTEFDQDGRHYLGTYLRPGLDVAILTRTDWELAMRATYLLSEKFILLGIMSLSAAVIYALLFARTLTNPLMLLYQGTQEIEKGNFDLDLKISSRDEIGILTNAFNNMSRKIRELMQEWIKKVQLEQELAIASTVQQTLIPESRFSNDRVYVRSHYQPATECGGDWWGLFFGHDKLCVMIADATGHGLPSALITAAARGYFSVMSKMATENVNFDLSPSEMLSIANRVVFEASLGKIQMTFFIGLIDFTKMTLTYSSGGHTPTWLFRKEGPTYVQKSLLASGSRLGEGPDMLLPEEKTVTIQPEDVIILYTDGILEGTDKAGTMYGKKRFKQQVDKSVADGPDAIVDQLMANFMEYNTGKSLDDDVTLAAIKLLPKLPVKS